MELKNTSKYDDILHLPHHISKSRTPMPISERAAQFSPFAALTGHNAAIRETERLNEQRIEDNDYASVKNPEEYIAQNTVEL